VSQQNQQVKVKQHFFTLNHPSSQFLVRGVAQFVKATFSRTNIPAVSILVTPLITPGFVRIQVVDGGMREGMENPAPD